MREKQPYVAFTFATTLLLASVLVKAQQGNAVFGHNFLFNMYTTEKSNMVTQPVYFSVSDTAIYTIFDRIANANNEGLETTQPASPIMLGVKLNPLLRNYHSAIVPAISQNYYSFLIDDSSDAVLVAMGINATNYTDFRYRVIENDSVELVPWTPVTDLRTTYGARQPFAFIGRFNRPGKWLVVEVYNIKNYAVREGVVFDWRTNLRPRLEQIIAGVPGNYFNLAVTGVNRGYASRFDKTTNAPEDLHLPADSIRHLTFKFKKEETRVYGVHLIREIAGKRDTLSQGMVDQHGYFSIDPSVLHTPGSYELVFQRQTKYPEWDDAKLLRIPFEITAPTATNTITKNILLILVIIICSLLLSFWIYRRNLKKMMRRLALQKEIAQLKLKSIRSQLNPHFIFNALSSIQNLMNKQAVTETNRYLSSFAKLTRAALESSEHEMISLVNEWEMAALYLQMEQLRFGFTCELVMDEQLEADHIDVPPMLLQPLIENAVRHGVAGNPKGHILLHARRIGSSLQLAVKDNGKGFTPNNTMGGFGLKLTREKVALLNDLYPQTPISLDIQTSEKGTSITITFKNWLA